MGGVPAVADRHVRKRVVPRAGIGPTGRYSPLRYPGGKGKLAKFMVAVVRANDLSDGRYIEPYAGGAGIAWELLITGVVRRVVINDISPHVSAFWSCVLGQTDDLCRRIREAPLTVEEWDRQKAVFARPQDSSTLDLGFSCFYLNRTNRSGILNGGLIGGRSQNANWCMDARFNREDLIRRITKIAEFAGRIEVSCKDAIMFLRERWNSFGKRDLIYVDPPYFEKGRMLYYDAYGPDDHADVAALLAELSGASVGCVIRRCRRDTQTLRACAPVGVLDRIQRKTTVSRSGDHVLQQRNGNPRLGGADADCAAGPG